MAPEELKKLQKCGKKVFDEASADKEDSQLVMGQAEVTRDEFGGYCCKRWGASGELTTSG